MDSKQKFSQNLNRLMEDRGKTRRDVCEAIDVSYYTFTSWCNGTKFPRIDKIEKLAKYFDVPKSALIEDPSFLFPSDVVNHAVDVVSSSVYSDEERRAAIDRAFGETKKAPVESDKGNRSAMEREFIELYHRLTPGQKKTVSALINALLEDKE